MIILADDLSGAAEVAGIGHRFGVSAELCIGAPREGGGEALVVDTESRALPAADAARVLRETYAALARGGGTVAYKKVDSVLRGPVRAELEAWMDASGSRRCILVPCNPSRGRTIEAGVYRVGDVPLDQTEFGRDPTHPARTARVVELLGPGSFPILSASPGEPLPPEGIVVGNAAQQADLEAWARLVQPGILAAGAADFLTAVLAARGPEAARERPLPRPAGRLLLVSGSASMASRSAVASLREAGAAVALVPPELAAAATDALARSARSAIAVDPEVRGAEPDRLLGLLARAAVALVARRAPRLLLLEGGSTAAAVVRALGWSRFRVEEELAPGVVALRPVAAPAVRVVLKPGSYPWPPGLL